MEEKDWTCPLGDLVRPPPLLLFSFGDEGRTEVDEVERALPTRYMLGFGPATDGRAVIVD